MNLNATQTRLLAVVDRHLDSLLDRPGMYGGPEAVEFQAIQAMEFRAHILRPDAPDRDILEQWQSLLRRLYPQHPNTYLHVILRRLHPSMDENEVLYDLAHRLRSFRMWVASAY